MGYTKIDYDHFLIKDSPRVDVHGLNEQTGAEASVVVKEMLRPDYRVVMSGVGELLFFKFLRPESKLILAVPSGTLSATEALLSFLEAQRIQVLQISVPRGALKRAGPRSKPDF